MTAYDYRMARLASPPIGCSLGANVCYEILRKLSELLSPARRRRAAGLQSLIVLNAIFQVAGVASLAPFIALLTNPSLIQKNPLTGALYQHLEFQNDVSFLIFFAILIIVFILLSSVLAALTTWILLSFSQDLGVYLQGALLNNYLQKEPTYFSRNNTSTITAMITQEAPRLIYMVVHPLLNMVSQLWIVVIVVIGLVVVDPTVALTAFVIVGALYYWMFGRVKKRLDKVDIVLAGTNALRHKVINESLGTVREVRLLALEQEYVSKLTSANQSSARAQTTFGLVADLPKFVIEAVAFSSLLAVAIYLIARNDSTASLVSYLSLYAMAGYKLLPAAQAVFRCASQIKANRSALDMVHQELRVMPASVAWWRDPPLEIPRLKTNLELDRVSYTYPGASVPTLEDITLRLKPGLLYAVVGASGAGKSTLADLILGLMEPTHGTLAVDGQTISRDNVRSWQRQLGYVPQSVFLTDDTITANIAFGIDADRVDRARVLEAADHANIGRFIDTLDEGYDYVIGERGSRLSGGQRQRIALARALYHDASVLVLDEATSALDNQTEGEVIGALQRLRAGKIILMIAHRITSIRNADEIIVLRNGRLEGMGTYR